jgi:hypothetical protein
MYETFNKDQKRQLNQILFSAIISFFKRRTTEGDLELRIRGNGVIKKTWEDIKKGNPMVRTSGSLGSATLPDVRTPYLRLRLPVIIRRVQRGEAKLVVDTAKLGEFLSLGPEEINRLAPLFSGPLPERRRSIWHLRH